jgi:hypothetical protein
MVHLGLQVSIDVLEQLLFRTPRNNMSPGIMADLTAALEKLERLQPEYWEQQFAQQQQQQQGGGNEQGGQELLWRQRRQEQQQKLAQARQMGEVVRQASGRQLPGSDDQQQQQQDDRAQNLEEEVGDVDLDALIDGARGQLVEVLGLGKPQKLSRKQGQQQQQRGRWAGDEDFVPLSAVAAVADAADEELDDDTKRRIGLRLQVVQELIEDTYKA